MKFSDVSNSSVASAANTVSVGAPGAERRLTNVAPGTGPNDVATFGQISSVAGEISVADQLARGLERQFAGPLKDTIIQRWRDPNNGAICYIYLPISAPHSAPTQPGFVQYGGNIIGTLSCYAGPPLPRAPAAQKK